MTMVKFLIAFICMSILAGSMMYNDHNEALNFYANGTVMEAKWNTSNHNMSLFDIRSKGVTKRLHHHQVILSPEQIKIGDIFFKESGNKNCRINDVEVQCVQ